MKKILLVAALLSFAAALWAAVPRAAALQVTAMQTSDSGAFPAFNQANELYSKGEYEKSAAAYENLASKNGAGTALYFNLGNAYYKTQRYGKSVLNYERAARLSPRDPDVRFNLNFLRNVVKEPPEPFPEIMVTWLNSLISLNELTILCSALFFALMFGLMAALALKRSGIIVFNAVCGLLLVVLSGWLLVKLNMEVFTREAIVVSGPADVRNGPGTENSVGFNLPEGRKVTVLGAKDDWAAIGLKSEGLKGWIEKKYLEEI